MAIRFPGFLPVICVTVKSPGKSDTCDPVPGVGPGTWLAFFLIDATREGCLSVRSDVGPHEHEANR